MQANAWELPSYLQWVNRPCTPPLLLMFNIGHWFSHRGIQTVLPYLSTCSSSFGAKNQTAAAPHKGLPWDSYNMHTTSMAHRAYCHGDELTFWGSIEKGTPGAYALSPTNTMLGLVHRSTEAPHRQSWGQGPVTNTCATTPTWSMIVVVGGISKLFQQMPLTLICCHLLFVPSCSTWSILWGNWANYHDSFACRWTINSNMYISQAHASVHNEMCKLSNMSNMKLGLWPKRWPQCAAILTISDTWSTVQPSCYVDFTCWHAFHSWAWM
jgi:hypothetical protein